MNTIIVAVLVAGLQGGIVCPTESAALAIVEAVKQVNGSQADASGAVRVAFEQGMCIEGEFALDDKTARMAYQITEALDIVVVQLSDDEFGVYVSRLELF